MAYVCFYCGYAFRWPPYQDNKLRACCSEEHRDISNRIIAREES